jgi:bacillithiol system protein YtxJ
MEATRDPLAVTTLLELDRAFDASFEAPVFFFKHSLTCPISAAAAQEYRSFVANRSPDSRVLYTLIEIQNAREISSELARRAGVKHESPQALLVRSGEVIWHASHWNISQETLEEALLSATE